MNLGENILKLRKKENLSQEQLAEKMKVTRQTISKWELNETTPDIKQAKELSKIFKISLDELTDNDIKHVLVERVSNTEKLAGIIIKILKVIGIVFLLLLIIDVIALILFTSTGSLTSIESSATIVCELEDNDYEITLGTDKTFICENCSSKINKEIKELVDYNDIDSSIKNIENYFKKSNGTCE